MDTRRPQLMWIGSVMLFVLTLDQVAKTWIRRTIEFDAPYRGDVFFHFTHQRNTGLMGGAFRDVPILPYVAPVIAFFVLVYMYRQLSIHSRLQSITFGVLLGGAFGNYIDRVRLGWVTDFLQFHFLFIPFDFPWKYYPSFNIADVGIICSIIVLFFTMKAPSEDTQTATPQDDVS